MAMQLLDPEQLCPECSRRFFDDGEELVCPGCGMTREKQVVEAPPSIPPRPHDSVKQFLGSYLGPKVAPGEQRSARGITGSESSYEYIKIVSDFIGRDEDSAVACARLIERVGEKLFVPRRVLVEAASMAKEVLAATRLSKRRVTVATVSAHALISACRAEGVTAVGVREIMDAHLALGKRVTSSSFFQLSLESPVRTFARAPRDYISRVRGRLTMSRWVSGDLARGGVTVERYFGALRRLAMELIELAEPTAMSGKKPCAVAASALYSAEAVMAALEHRKRRVTQRQLAESAGASEYTVREQCAVIFAPSIKRLAARMKIPPPPAGGR